MVRGNRALDSREPGGAPEAARGLPAVWPGLFFFGILLALSLLIYWPVLNNTLIADDYFWMHLGKAIPAAHLWKLFTVQPHFSVRPLTALTFWVQSRLFFLNPWPSHLINVVLHAGAASVLSWILLRLGAGKLTAVAAALLFVLTPMAPEAVTWSSGRFDVLATFLILLAVGLYGVSLLKHSRGAFLGAMAAAAAAMLSKETALVLVIILPMMEFMYGGLNLSSAGGDGASMLGELRWRMARQAKFLLSERGFFLRVSILFLIVIANVILRFAILGKLGGYPNVPLFGRPVPGSVLASFKALISPLNRFEAPRLAILALAAYTLALLLVGAFLVIFRWSRSSVMAKRLLLLLGALFVLTVAPVYTPLFIFGVSQGLMDSRELYAPTVFFIAIMSVALLEFGWRERSWRIGASAALLILIPVYASGLYLNNRTWQRGAAVNYSLLKQTAALVPDPPWGAKMTFVNVPDWKNGSYIFITGLPAAVHLTYGRDDLTVTRPANAVITAPGAIPGDADGYIFYYSQSDGLLQLVRQPRR